MASPATRSELPRGVQALEVAHRIKLTVLDDMRLIMEPVEIARDAEHNSATFYIAAQPSSLDTYVCRAEVKNARGTNHRLVTNGEFSLTSDIAVTGMGSLQLVYSDGAEVVRKTYAATFHVSASLNAVDPSEPEFENGLAQITRAAFANAVGDDTGIQFYNIADQPLDFVAWPPGSGEGLDEALANTLYLRLDGTNPMQGSVGIIGPNRGVSWGESSIQGALYSTGSQLVMRLPLGDPPFQIEPNSGAGAERTPVMTERSGDVRYLREINANQLYCSLDGTQMRGPFISQLGSSNTNLGLSVGENSSGFWKSSLYLICSVGGATAWQSSATEMMLGVRLNAATQQITNLGDPTAAQDAVNRRTMDAAIAAIPRPAVPANRIFIPNEVTISTSVQVFFDQPFFTADNAQRTILVTFYPQFAEGTPSAFYDLEYTCSIAPLVVERTTVYPTANAYMSGSAIAFAATVTPASSQIPVQLTVRAFAAGTTALVQIGSRATQRSYIQIQEMTT